MLYPVILAALILVSFYVVQSRFNVIEELRKPSRVVDFFRNHPRLQFVSIMVVYLSLISWYMHPIFSGSYPIGGDHHVHLAKIHLLDGILKNWEVRTWSHDFFAGFPYGYLYSPLAEFFPISLNAVTFNWLSFENSYSWTIFFVYFLKSFAGFLLGYRAFGLGAGFLTGLFIVIDPGFAHQGGRSWFLSTGVWVSDFAIAVQLMGIAFIRDIWSGPTKKSFFVFTLFSGLAFLIHPLTLILWALTTCTSLLSYIVTQSIDFPIFRRSLTRYLISATLAMLIGSYFLLPFISFAEHTRDFGAVWFSISEMGKNVSELKLFGDQNPIVFIFGCLALILLTLSNKFWPFFVAITTLISFVVFSTDIFIWLPFLKHFPFITHIELARTAIFIKYFFFAGSAFLLTKFIKSLASMGDLIKIESNKLKAIVRLILVSGILAILVYPFSSQAIFSFSKNTTTFSNDHSLSDPTNKVAVWLKKNVGTSDGMPVRTALWSKPHTHNLFDIYSRTKLPIYNVHYTPATNFNSKPESTNQQLLNHLNVKFVVSDQKLPSQSYRKRISYPPYTIYENKSWKKSDPWRIMRGSGKISNIKVKKNTITFSTTKNSTGQAMFFVSYFPNWHLYFNGNEDALRHQAYLGIKNTDFMVFDLKPGNYELRFEKGAIEILSVLLSVFGIALLILILINNRLSFKIL